MRICAGPDPMDLIVARAAAGVSVSKPGDDQRHFRCSGDGLEMVRVSLELTRHEAMLPWRQEVANPRGSLVFQHAADDM